MARPTNALIVDDEAHVRMFARLLLAELGITNVWEGNNGQRAIDLAREHQPELVLLDVNMPVMGGIEALAELKAANPDLPVVMLSSENAMQTVRDAARLGAMGYILKQSPKDEALESLRELVEALAEGEEESTE